MASSNNGWWSEAVAGLAGGKDKPKDDGFAQFFGYGGPETLEVDVSDNVADSGGSSGHDKVPVFDLTEGSPVPCATHWNECFELVSTDLGDTPRSTRLPSFLTRFGGVSLRLSSLIRAPRRTVSGQELPVSGQGTTETELREQLVEAMQANVFLVRSLMEECRRTLVDADDDASGAEAIRQELVRLKLQHSRYATALRDASATGGCDGTVRDDRLEPSGLEEDGELFEDCLEEHDLNDDSTATPRAGISDPRKFGADAPDLLGDVDHEKPWPLVGLANVDAITESSALTRPLSGDGKAGLRLNGAATGKGAGGKPCMPPPPGGASKGGKKGRTPLGRRFHWKGLSADRIRGTIFEDDAISSRTAEAAEPVFDTELLQSLFAGSENQTGGSCQPEVGNSVSLQRLPSIGSGVDAQTSDITVFTHARAQHMAIVLHRAVGPTCTVDDMASLASRLQRLDLPLGETSASRMREGERLELLSTVTPSPEEIVALEAAPLERLRRIEKLILPLARVPRATERLRALCLAAQSGALHEALQARMRVLTLASQSTRASDALRRLLRSVARLGSWINSADPAAQRGFALSSALGKLRQFRAFHGDRGVSLLHVVLLAAALGNPKEAGELGARLGRELAGVAQAARQDWKDLAQAVASFQSDADWYLTQADILPTGAAAETGGYVEETRTRLHELHEELARRAKDLQEALATTRAELEATMSFFAEHWDAEKEGFELVVERFFQTVSEFRLDLLRVAREVTSQPNRFSKVCAVVSPTDSNFESSAGGLGPAGAL